MHLVVITHIPSPYQVELFNAIAALRKIELEVVYLYRTHSLRRWAQSPVCHKAVFLDAEPYRIQEVSETILRADLVVFNYYAQRQVLMLIHLRARSNKAWCFWGERLGYWKPGWFGKLVRRCLLSSLHNSQSPIWGIGQAAVKRYQEEFGLPRSYYNVPYFSDLKRFTKNCLNSQNVRSERVFFFSGSLIPRKGVDLLARAFLRLAHELPNVHLKLLGDGELRDSMTHTLQPVRDRVEFLGFKDWQELPTYYANADILCVPSRHDGWGLVVPEGLASGLPVVSTNCTGAAVEFIETGRNGWLIQANDENALYLAMHEAALLPSEKLAELSSNARESVSEHSLDQGAERFIRAAYDTVENWKF